MKGGRSMILGLVLLSCFWQLGQSQCDLKPPEDVTEEVQFPDLFKETRKSYEMSVEYTPKNAKQSNYYKEYYDSVALRGRVDAYVDGKSSSYYYYSQTNEAFEVSGFSCDGVVLNETTPRFMKDEQSNWNYVYGNEPTVRGPSAMFRYALSTWKNNKKSMAYMGQSNHTERKIPVQQWRRCEGNLTYDYYFTMETHDDASKYKDLTMVPIKVEVLNAKDEDYPQIYEIMFLQPFISNQLISLEVPTGKGCKRGDSVKKPEMKKYLDSTIFTMAEAVCVNCDGKKPGDDEGIWNYYSTFTYAVDQQTNQFAYIYTPWGNVDETGKQIPEGLKHVYYDGKNEYLYTQNLATDNCEITRQPTFSPRYYFPKGVGYIDLTDEFILYPDQEYDYLDDGVYKGMPVHIYEAVEEGYLLGNRTIERAVFSRYYFKDKITSNENVVPGALTAIEMRFFPNKTDLTHSFQLTFNFYGFATQIPYRRSLFRIVDCFKNEADSVWVTLTFPADPPALDKLKEMGPNIELDVFDSILQNSELNALRIPTMLLDISNAVYVTMQILEKPPIELDFTGEEKGKKIVGTTRTEGVTDMQSCGKICVESEPSCWGVSICGGLCYLGVGKTSKDAVDKDCSLYRRYSNTSFIPSKEMMVTNIRKEVEEHRIIVEIPGLGDNKQPLQLEATFVDQSKTSNQGGKLGTRTDPRLTIFKAGAKLVKGGEVIKNLGSLGYEECQKVCLDYKTCETASFCSNGQCVISGSSAGDLSKDSFVPDNLCTVVTRKYADRFINAPGTFLTRSYRKGVKAASAEDCARLCFKEGSFTCFSFDYCPWDTSVTCLLHDVHFLDLNKQESMKTNNTCGHYYKKFSYDFKRKPQQRSLGSTLVPISKVNLETCARSCVELKSGKCLGYDFCEDKTLTSTSCIILTDKDVASKTEHSDVCDHYTKIVLTEKTGSSGSSVWIGIVCFLVAAVFGVIAVFGFGYMKARRSG